jgi:hypothetical protein
MAIRVGHSTSGQGGGAVGISAGIDKNRQHNLQKTQLAQQQQQIDIQKRRMDMYRQQLISKEKMSEREAEIRARQMEAAAREAEQQFQLATRRQDFNEATGLAQLDQQQQRIDQVPYMAELGNELDIQRDMARLTASQRAEVAKLQESLNRIDMMVASGELPAEAADAWKQEINAKMMGIKPPVFNTEQPEPTPEERFMQSTYEDENGDIWTLGNNGWTNTTQSERVQTQKAKETFRNNTFKDLLKQTKQIPYTDEVGNTSTRTEPMYSPQEAMQLTNELVSLAFGESHNEVVDEPDSEAKKLLAKSAEKNMPIPKELLKPEVMKRLKQLPPQQQNDELAYIALDVLGYDASDEELTNYLKQLQEFLR